MSTDPATGAAAPAPDPMAALVDIRNQVIRLGQEVAALRTEQPAHNPDAINAVTAELREAVRFLAERLDGVARMVAQRGEELADTRGALGAIDAHVRSQAETIGVLTTGMQALPSYGQQVSALQDTLNALQQRLGGIEASLGQRLGGIEQALARPPDAQVSERLSAIEGMLGPLAQRLAQAHNDHAASLQALHGRVESLASGTQAALSQPAAIDEAALAGLDAKFAAVSGEIQSLRSDVAALVAARGSSEGSSTPVDLSPLAMQLTQLSGEMQSLRSDVAAVVAARAASAGSEAAPAEVDLSPLSDQLAALGDQVAALAAAPARADAPDSGAQQDVDAAIAAAEQRLMAHVDDAVFALAQTLLGKTGGRGEGHAEVPAADAPEPPVTPSPAPVADHVDATDSPAGYDETDVDDGYDDEGYDDEAPEVAQIDFSRAELDDEDADTVSWERPVDDDAADADAHAGVEDRDDPPEVEASRPDEDPRDAGPAAGRDAPFDAEAAWGPARVPVPPDGPSTVVPERRRRWFSW